MLRKILICLLKLFGLYEDKKSNTPEIDDSTHNSYKRRQRDEKINNICHDVGIKILHFYTSYPNEESYVLNRILKNLNNNIDNKVSNAEENNTYTLVR